jgi:hypothetical protein
MDQWFQPIGLYVLRFGFLHRQDVGVSAVSEKVFPPYTHGAILTWIVGRLESWCIKVGLKCVEQGRCGKYCSLLLS